MVPRIREIMALWEDTLARLESDVGSLVGRLDWVLKRALLEKAREEEGLEWESAEMRYLDQIYHSLDRSEGLYWAVEAEGGLERLVSDAEIERFVHQPPEDTRAWTRAQLMRRVPPEAFDFIDWDRIRFRRPAAGSGGAPRTLHLPDPLAFTLRQTEEVFRSATGLDQLLDALSVLAPPGGAVHTMESQFKE